MTAAQFAAHFRDHSLRLALGAAVVLLLAARLGYGLLESRYGQAFRSVPLPRGSLEKLPQVLGEWQGHPQPMKAAIIKATDTDDHVSRFYRSAREPTGVSLWIGYGGRLRDMLPHRPEVCYPANGYTLEEERHVQLKSSDGTLLPCRILYFARGGLQAERVVVLNYYLVDGEYSPDVSLLRTRAMRFQAGGRYVVQVQISSIYDPLRHQPDAAVRGFAEASADAIRETVQAAVRTASPLAGKEPK